MEQILILSIKPQYVEKILNGSKTIELRKSLPKKVSKGSLLLIYVTTPKRCIQAICEIDKIVYSTPNELWEIVKGNAGISKREYNNYYNTNKRASAIFLRNVEPLEIPIGLTEIRNSFPNFSPPQTFKYLSLMEIQDSILESCL